MAALKEVGIARLNSAGVLVDMKTAASTTLFTVPTGKIARILAVCVRDPTASLAGGTSYSFTNWLQTVSLATLTTLGTDYIFLLGPLAGPTTKYTEIGSGVNFQITVTTGSTLAANATLDVFGYLT